MKGEPGVGLPGPPGPPGKSYGKPLIGADWFEDSDDQEMARIKVRNVFDIQLIRNKRTKQCMIEKCGAFRQSLLCWLNGSLGFITDLLVIVLHSRIDKALFHAYL